MLWSSSFLLADLAHTNPEVVDRFRTDPTAWNLAGVLGSNALFGVGWLAVAVVEWRRRAGSRLGWTVVAAARPLSKLVDHVVDLRFCGQLDKGLLIW